MSAGRNARRLAAKRQASLQQGGVNVVDRMLAQSIGKRLPELEAADVVVAVLPDQQRVLVKGKVRLTAIGASGISRECQVTIQPVPSAECAAALKQVLGGDGHTSAWTRVGA